MLRSVELSGNMLRECLLLCRYRDEAAVTSRLREDDYSVRQCVERVVLAHTHVFTGVVLCPSLTYDDISSLAGFASKDLNA